MKDILSHLNTADSPPKKGDVLVIRTKKSGDQKILVAVKDVIKTGNDHEIILNKSTNSYFIWSMFEKGESWVARVWNLGDIAMTASTNNANNLIDM